MTLKDILFKLETNQPFALTRWGDGEWYNIRKLKGANCDGNIYYPDLGDALKEIVSVKQDYILGAQDYKTFNLDSDVEKYYQDWIDADIFHKASMQGNLQPLIETLKNKYVTYIGNQDLKKLSFVTEFITIPQNNVWLQREALLNLVRSTFDDKQKVYCFSAGMATNVFIHELWKENKTNTYIDVGSVFDPYVGKATRGYHKSLNLNKWK